MTLETTRPPPPVTYWAISLFSSRTFWWNAANGLSSILSLAEVNVLKHRSGPTGTVKLAFVGHYTMFASATRR